MKSALKVKLIFTIILLNLIFCRIIGAQTRIAVLPFTSEDNINKSVLSYLTEVFTVEMVNSKQVIVVERTRLDAALKEMSLQNGDMFDENSAIEVGKLAGAEIVIFGTIFKFNERNILSVKGMDIKTATLKYAKQEKAESDSELELIIKKIANQIIQESIGGNVSDLSFFKPNQPLNNSENKFYENKIKNTWQISPDNKENMSFYYKRYIAAGVSIVSVGSTLLLSSMIVGIVSLWASYQWGQLPTHDVYDQWSGTIHQETDDEVQASFYNGIWTWCGISSTIILGCGIIVTALCFVPFYYAGKVSSIYRKTTGQKLTFFDRTFIGGGYDWENKEVTVAMAIKL